MRRILGALAVAGSGCGLAVTALAQSTLPPPGSAPVRPPAYATPAPAAKAAPVKAEPIKSEPMKVRIVRSNQPGCEPNCPEWISAEGQIEAGTPAEFRTALAKLGTRKLPILIDSVGGSVDPSLSIARMVRARGLDVVVTKTVLAPCDPADKDCLRLKARGIELGRPEARISKCASSCAFILAGGVRRYVGAWTVVGLHEIKSIHTLRLVRQYYRMQPGFFAPAKKTIVKQETVWSDKYEAATDEKTYDKIKKFFVEMGVSETIMPILRSAPHSSIRWLRLPDLKATALATDFINGEQLLLPQSAAVASVSPATPGYMPRAVEPSLAPMEVGPPAAAATGARTGNASKEPGAATAPNPSPSPAATANAVARTKAVAAAKSAAKTSGEATTLTSDGSPRMCFNPGSGGGGMVRCDDARGFR